MQGQNARSLLIAEHLARRQSAIDVLILALVYQ